MMWFLAQAGQDQEAPSALLIGAVVAMALGLVKALEAAASALSSRMASKNGEIKPDHLPAHIIKHMEKEESIIQGLTRSWLSVEKQVGLLVEGISSLTREVSEIKRSSLHLEAQHSLVDSEQTPLWYVPRAWGKTMEKMLDALQAMSLTVGKAESSGRRIEDTARELRSRMESLEREMLKLEALEREILTACRDDSKGR